MTGTGKEQELPFDEGRAAYIKRLHYNVNPYPENAWQHNEWWLGWTDAEECDATQFDWKADQFIPPK